MKTNCDSLSGDRVTIELVVMLTLLASMAFFPMSSSAGSLSTSVIGMFPKQVSEFAYLDLKSARQNRWFPEFRDQLLPPHFHEFERFLSSAGLDLNTHVDELTWCELPISRKGGEQVVGIGLGSFDPSSNEERFKQFRLPVVDYQGYHLYANGAATGAEAIFFTFLDSNLAAFGHRSALENLVDLRMGRGESLLTNDTLFPLISEANGSGAIWAVFDKAPAGRVIQRLIPQASLFPQTALIINRMHALMVNVSAESGLDARLQAVCDSVEDANLLGAALQLGVMYRRNQEEQSHPDLAQEMLDNLRVAPSGDRLKVEGSVSDDQLDALIKNKTFAVPM